jgi:DNA-directed RNA polymerase II subunit RPB2
MSGENSSWDVIASYYKDNVLGKLVRHQHESYNEFVHSQLRDTIQMFNPILARSNNDYDPNTKSYRFEVEVNVINPVLNPAIIHENNGVKNIMFPHDARSRNFTYNSVLTVDIEIKYHVRGNDAPIVKYLKGVTIGKVPVMVKSAICSLNTTNNISAHKNECHMDPGGYFIISGSEKVVIGQERTAENHPLCFNVSKSSSTYTSFVDVKSVPHKKCISPRQFSIMIAKANNGYGHALYAQLSRIKQHVPLFVLFRAYGIVADKDICEHIIGTSAADEDVFRPFLQASAVDASEVLTQEDALEYISKRAMFSAYKKAKGRAGGAGGAGGGAGDTVAKSAEAEAQELEEIETRRTKFMNNVYENEILPHCIDAIHKTHYFGHMAQKVILTAVGKLAYDDRDSYINKRVDTCGVLLNNLFRNYYNKLTKDMQKQLVYEINNGSWKSTDAYENIMTHTNIYKIIKVSTIENGLNRALSTGDFGTRNGNDKVGVAQVLNRLNYMSLLSHLRRVNTPIDKSGKLVAPRKLHPTTWGMLCPAESPEGQSVGVVKNLASMAVISMASDAMLLREKIVGMDSVDHMETASYKKVGTFKVISNGEWIGTTDNPEAVYDQLKAWKARGIITAYTSITMDPSMWELNVHNEGGRLMRPLFTMHENQVVHDTMVVGKGGEGGAATQDNTTWDACIRNLDANGKSAIEYIDVAEQNCAMIKMNRTDAKPGVQYTHMEIHPSTIFGVLASCIPFPDHNQSPRNTYQCAMGKQAMGTYSREYLQRMDKTAYVASYPTKPLVDTRMSGILNLDKMPNGTQSMVAIMSYTGYNVEDSVLINQGSIDRGMFQTVVLSTERDEDSNTHGEEEIRCKPDKSRTQGIKFGNYNKVGSNGVIGENEKLEKGDILMAKVSTIKENRNDPSKVIKYRDESVIFRSADTCYVDKTTMGRNGDGYKFCKIRLRDTRSVDIGDKFCSRHGQKGTVGNILPESDMPYTKDGIKPDIIINPHAIPSRMTIAQLKETLLGKVLLELGMIGDGSPFGDLTVDDIRKKLAGVGYESNGNEIMYNGQTGEMLESSVFVGPVYYQRLKHLAGKKVHSREIGPMISLTRQPGEGRSKDGGLRIGEMERDGIASHGAARFCKERLYDSSDSYDAWVCGDCGMIACYNERYNVHNCTMCQNKTNFSYVQIPYAFKLLVQELECCNIAPRLIVEPGNMG